jgi:hypothetical protein
LELCIDAEQLRKALADIEQSEANGFRYCLAVFTLSSAGSMIDQCRMTYSDKIEKAHPTDPRLDWGRFQGVSRNNRFTNGKLIPIKKAKVSAKPC